jgi:hypothetical protein
MSAQADSCRIDPQVIGIDTLMSRILHVAAIYEHSVREYRAELYLKGKVDMKKSNIVLRFVPSMFRPQKGVKQYITESFSDLHYTAPNIYDQKVKASTGTIPTFGGVEGLTMEYFHINIYEPTLLYKKLISPLSSDARKNYNYRLDSVMERGGQRLYRITYTPKYKSYQLLKGYMVVSDGVWSVRELMFSGRSEFYRFENHIKMGEVGEKNELLPVSYEAKHFLSFLWNVVDAYYTAKLDYKEILYGEFPLLINTKRKKRYDLSDSYTLSTDTAVYRMDSLTFSSLRPVPLSDEDNGIYRDYWLRKDTTVHHPINEKKSRILWGQLKDMLISDYSINLADIGKVRCSPLFNPLLMSYSGTNGLSYKQTFKYSRLFQGDRLLRVNPRIGYNFKRKEFYWSVRGDYDYWPRKRASVHVDMGNGNRVYGSDVLTELESIPDSIFDFNKIHLEYFRDLYFNLYHSVELVNGLTIDLGITTHQRTAVEKSVFEPVSPGDGEDEKEDVIDKFKNEYISFAPRLGITWTPGQYYYMSGDRKINLKADYPTFSLNYERGIRGVMGSNGEYERVELDIQQAIPLAPMRNLFYRIGGGKFTNQDQLFFVDFERFAKHNLPVGWNDEIGGTFQLLDGRWYNFSRHYLRGHLTYEAPFLLTRHILKHRRFVLNERLYFSALSMNRFSPYVELGYGIGTHIFDLGFFVSADSRKTYSFGFEITFELFNR